MNFLADFYFREGPGISKDVPKPTGLRLLAQVLRREWFELVKLNLLCIVFCLPLVTLPAAWFATTSICVSMIEDRNVYLLRDFWTAFRSRFWAATALGAALCAVVAAAIVALCTYFGLAVASPLFVVPFAIATTVAVLAPLLGAHLFVALARNQGRPFRQIAWAAALGMLSRPLPGLGALAFVALLWLVHVAFYPASVLLPVLVNFSFGALLSSFAVMGGVEFGLSHAGSRPRGERPQDRTTQSAQN
jgi:uncharacterized membrane protein YesL